MKTLADFKRFLAEPDATLTLIKYAVDGKVVKHRYQDVERKVGKLQTNAFALTLPDGGRTSWVYFGSATEWAFDDNLVVHASDGIVLIYRRNK